MTDIILKQIAELKDALSRGGTVFFGGAGVSTESGIPDFRGTGGLYTDSHDELTPEEMLHRKFFDTYPEIFYAYYRSHMLYPDAKPGPAHISLARLEHAGLLGGIITQNIDGLHQSAGSSNVCELHGSVHRNYCIKCGEKYGIQHILSSESVPKCLKCGDVVRPDVVLYGEELDRDILDKSISHIKSAKTLVVGGTSLGVYPAAGLLRYFQGDSLILINKTKTPYDSDATLRIFGSVGVALSKVCESLI